jgi:hypothetical protein
MASGPEHYRRAEDLVTLAGYTPAAVNETSPAAGLLLAEAQIHATLALAAATSASIPLIDIGVGNGELRRQWVKATAPTDGAS